MSRDEIYMQRCLQLARLGLGKVQPNPMVGAVIVHNDCIIGEGYHHQYGEVHAEINAINSVGDKNLLRESTIYVSLEPCSHYGKTPPCADAIIRYGFPKVVIGTIDYHDKVNGSGIQKLRQAGIEVVEHVCEEACVELNRRFFTFHKQHRPYVILKWAQTLDGYMDVDRSDGKPHTYWITNPALKVLVHKWRSEEDAILVGYQTMKNDQPQLTTRLYPGKNPQRFVMQRTNEHLSGNEYQILPMDIEKALRVMYEARIQSVIVEGGRKTLDRFIASGFWDEARILVGGQTWNGGLKAPQIPSPFVSEEQCVDDNKILYVRRHV